MWEGSLKTEFERPQAELIRTSCFHVRLCSLSDATSTHARFVQVIVWDIETASARKTTAPAMFWQCLRPCSCGWWLLGRCDELSRVTLLLFASRRQANRQSDAVQWGDRGARA